jgi:hypothetical protein
MSENRIYYTNTVFLLVGVLGLIAFIISVKSLFFYDEDIFITNLQSPFMQQVWERSFIIKQVFKIQHFFFDKNPAGYHIVSAVLHIFNSFVALQLFKKLLNYYSVIIDNKPGLLFIFFIVFLFSAIHSEPLSYLLGQGIFVFSLCSQFCIIYFIKYLQGKTTAIFFAVLFFILAILCYEISWLLPLMLLCIVFFKSGFTIANGKKQLLATGVFFIVLALWMYIKITYISAALVTDYKNVSLSSIDIVQTSRNSVMLFLRNFIPPLESTRLFISVSIVLLFLIVIGFTIAYKYHKKTFAFLVLLFALTILAFLPTSLFGIDSHDAESERYVYFSSHFALMMLMALLFINIRLSQLQKIITAALVLFYGFILFNTIGAYSKAGAFSKLYLDALNKNTADKNIVYTINQPSQYKGALLLRALTRMPQLSGFNYTVLNEYSHYLYGNKKIKFNTLSAKELKIPPTQLYTVIKTTDSASHFFSQELSLHFFANLPDSNFAIAGLRNDTLFIFK